MKAIAISIIIMLGGCSLTVEPPKPDISLCDTPDCGNIDEIIVE